MRWWLVVALVLVLSVVATMLPMLEWLLALAEHITAAGWLGAWHWLWC